VIVEIQENSDTTYRIHDWDRAEKRRAPREMHIAQAMQCIDFADFEPSLLAAKGETLATHERFQVDRWELAGERQIAERGRFAIAVCLNGEIECASRRFKPGDFFLVPAALEDRMIRPVEGTASILRVTAPRP
jgi:mannose-6-phosphate isomerase